MNAMLTEHIQARREAANAALEAHDFGPRMTVAGMSGWGEIPVGDDFILTRPVFLNWKCDEPTEPSHKVEFVCRVKQDGTLLSAGANDDMGHPIGRTPGLVEPVASFSVFDDLYQSAAAVLAESAALGHNSPMLERLAERLVACREQIEERMKFAPEIAKARLEYADENCEIDDHPNVAAAETGVWVSSWVFVNTDLESEGD